MHTENPDIVNVDNEIVGKSFQKKIYKFKYFHREMHIISDATSRFLLQQCRRNKNQYVNRSFSINGHIISGKEYNASEKYIFFKNLKTKLSTYFPFELIQKIANESSSNFTQR